jgi:hypothetical protein
MDYLSPPRPPVVSSLPAAGTLGRLVTLSTDGNMYYDNGSSWVALSASSGGGGVTISDTAPAFPHENQFWWDSLYGGLYVQYSDGTSTQWVDSSRVGGSIYVGPNTPTLSGAGLWVQTGLGDGSGVTFWVEDGI